MYCQNCGAKINDDTKFCGNCGKMRSDVKDGRSERKKTNWSEKPLWKKIIIVIVAVWSILVLMDFVVTVFMAVTLGDVPNNIFVKVIVWIIAMIAVFVLAYPRKQKNKSLVK